MQRRVTLGVPGRIEGWHGGAVIVRQAVEELRHHILTGGRQVVALIWVVGNVEEPEVLVVGLGRMVWLEMKRCVGCRYGDPAAVA